MFYAKLQDPMPGDKTHLDDGLRCEKNYIQIINLRKKMNENPLQLKSVKYPKEKKLRLYNF